MKAITCLFCERMRKNFSFCQIIVLAILMNTIHKSAVFVGRGMRSIGKILVNWGSVETPRWTTDLLRRAHMVDAEIHMDGFVYRGPLYATYRQFTNGDKLVLSMNWVAEGTEWGGYFAYSGSRSFILSHFGEPHLIKGDSGDNRAVGNVWFFFEGGWVVLYLGTPREHLLFEGEEDTPRVYAYY